MSCLQIHYIHKITHEHLLGTPKGIIHNSIDYMLTPERFFSSIQKTTTRTYPRADINSDHDLVLINMKLKLRTQTKRNSRVRFNIEKLNYGKINKQYQDVLENKLISVNIV